MRILRQSPLFPYILIPLYLISLKSYAQQSPRDYCKKGNEKVKSKNYDGAFDDFNKALKLDPKYAPAYNGRGLVKTEQNNLEGAIKDFDMAIKLMPNYADAYKNRGFAKYKKGDNVNSKHDFDRFLQLKPNIGE